VLNNLNEAIELMRGEKVAIENERDSLVENQASLTQEREEYSQVNSELTQQMAVWGREK
jgi:prefoldin subunit 5